MAQPKVNDDNNNNDENGNNSDHVINETDQQNTNEHEIITPTNHKNDEKKNDMNHLNTLENGHNKTYMIGSEILNKNYKNGDVIYYDSDPEQKDITNNIHQHRATIIELNDNQITLKLHTSDCITTYNLSNIHILLDENENAIDIMENRQKTPGELAIYSEDDEKAEKVYHELVKEIHNEPTFPKLEHDELEYRPFKYVSTLITRPNLRENKISSGIKYSKWSIEHEYNYFRYWIGRYSTFRDKAKQIANDFKTVIQREEYDLDNVAEDMSFPDDDDDDDELESMILAEEEFDKYSWDNSTQHKLRLICCEVINILPFYKEWINLLRKCNIGDMAPSIDQECRMVPCIPLQRLLIVSKFYNRWVNQNLSARLESKNQFHFSVHDFMDALEHYNSVEFQNDYQHLQHCHLEPTNQKTRINDANTSSSTLKDNEESDESSSSDDESDSSSDDDTDDDADDENDDDMQNLNKTKTIKRRKSKSMSMKKMKKLKKKHKKNQSLVTLDSLNRNIYEWFEDNLEDCNVSTCPIFERTYRSRYDANFEEYEAEYYALNSKELNDWMQKVSEVQCQKIFDGMHTLLFHSSARYQCIGLGNSEEHRKFVMLASEKRKKIQQNSNK